MSHVILHSVNLGGLTRLTPGRGSRTGIRKQPVGGPVLCDAQGLVGDAIGNHKHHGGPDQAVYLYSAEDYAWWSATLGRSCHPGLFGENLTIDQWWEAPRIGDRVHFGDVILEITAPRIPCSTLATRMENARFTHDFARADRPGAYARVIQPGALDAGRRGELVRGHSTWPTVQQLYRLWLDTPRPSHALLEALRAPVAQRLREAFLTWAADRQ